MKRTFALAATAGILLGGCAVDNDSEALRASAGRQLTATERLQANVGRDIIPRLGSTGLILVLGKQDEATNSISLVVTRDTVCASEFSFSKTDHNNSNVNVRLDLFGNYLDLIDTRQLDGSAMYDGTIGHGDNITHMAVNYTPGSNTSTNSILEFMKHVTEDACDVVYQSTPG